MQRAIQQIKGEFPDLVVVADTCLCQFTSHGHCGVIEDGIILNDESLAVLAKTAVSRESRSGHYCAIKHDGRIRNSNSPRIR